MDILDYIRKGYDAAYRTPGMCQSVYDNLRYFAQDIAKVRSGEIGVVELTSKYGFELGWTAPIETEEED